MFNSSIVARRLLRSRQALVSAAQRQMASSSVLLVPLKEEEQLPWEIRTTDLTDAEVEQLQQGFREFNARCSEELKEMNQNRITNIIERGGVENWETASDLAHLKRSYNFTSALQAQYFVQSVGRFCSQKEHHPEWSVTDGGRTVNVKLTSHFAGNKITLFDFQLAEHMNQQYKVTQKWFSEYPLITQKTWASWKIFLIGFFMFNFMLQVGTHWGVLAPSSTQRGEKSQAGHYRPLMVTNFEISAGGSRAPREAELYAMANVDDYAFKTNLFSSRKMI